MSSPSSVLSRTVESITIEKIKELNKKKSRYESRKRRILESTDEAGDVPRDRVKRLLNGYVAPSPDKQFTNFEASIDRRLHQADCDPSVSTKSLNDIESDLRNKLEHETRRMNLVDLNNRLLMEWLHPPQETIGNNRPDADLDMKDDESFEMVERDRLQQLRNKFEAAVFKRGATSKDDINEYLDTLFERDDYQLALRRIRGWIQSRADNLRELCPFTKRDVKSAIEGLLGNDLLNDEKKMILKKFLQDDLVLAEISDVLSMRFADLESWTWGAPNQGMYVEPRRELNGKYRIIMDEDVLQAIFLQQIGESWCTHLSEILTAVVDEEEIMTSGGKPLSEPQWDRRAYYTSKYSVDTAKTENVQRIRNRNYRTKFLVAQLRAIGYDGDEGMKPEANQESATSVKQSLLRLLATELITHRATHNEAAIVQSDMQWFGTSLPHNTILAVLEFFGFPEYWITFFKKFLETPLDMGTNRAPSDSSQTARIRLCGMPMAHTLEKVFGELVLFCMDVAVQVNAGMPLYRLHDDLWLVGKPNECAKAWEVMGTVAKLMGMDFNQRKTGSVYLTDGNEPDQKILEALPKGRVSMGFLELNAKTGDWEIDQKSVEAHINQLQKQLSNCTSVLAWIQTWNSCIGRFFGHNFGEPALCFGPAHIESILEIHRQMQLRLFAETNGSVAQYLKQILSERFGVSNIPDAFIFLPEQLGGLGLRNPFIPLLNISSCIDMKKTPKEQVEAFFRKERSDFGVSREFFLGRETKTKKKTLTDLFADQPNEAPENPEEFMSFEEFVGDRERNSSSFARLYEQLQRKADPSPLQIPKETKDALVKMSRNISLHNGGKAMELTDELEWTVEQFWTELLDYCGEINLAHQHSLPLGVLAMLKSRKVTWHMVL